MIEGQGLGDLAAERHAAQMDRIELQQVKEPGYIRRQGLEAAAFRPERAHSVPGNVDAQQPATPSKASRCRSQ